MSFFSCYLVEFGTAAATEVREGRVEGREQRRSCGVAELMLFSVGVFEWDNQQKKAAIDAVSEDQMRSTDF